MLLNVGANVNEKSNWGRTPLILSATNGHIDVVRELLNHGASVDIVDIYGYTPLYAADQRRHVEVVREFADHGAKVNIKYAYFSTLFSAAISIVARGREELIREIALCLHQ